MIPSAFDYVRVSSVDEAVAALTEHGEDAKLLAGGHSLLPIMKLRLAVPAVLASGFYQAYDELSGDSTGVGVSWGPTILATVIAFGVGLTVIAWLLRYLDRGSFTPFVVYRIGLGVLVLVLVFAGVLDPEPVASSVP